MTRLFSATYGEVSEFVKQLAFAGLTDELRHELMTDPARMKTWVAWLTSKQEHSRAIDGSGIATVSKTFMSRDVSLVHRLHEEDIYYLDELADWSKDELSQVRNIGEGRLTIIKEVLELNGLSLSQHLPNDPNRVLNQRGSRAYPRATIDRVHIRSLFCLSSRSDLVGHNTMPNVRFGAFKHMSDEVLESFFTPSGIGKISRWRRENGL